MSSNSIKFLSKCIIKYIFLTFCCSKERTNFQQQLHKMTELYEGRLQQYIYESETKHKMEMDEIDERKSNQIMKLIKEHEESLADARNYYTDIVQNNLTLIGSLKEQMEELSTKLENSEHQLKRVNGPKERLHFLSARRPIFLPFISCHLSRYKI